MNKQRSFQFALFLAFGFMFFFSTRQNAQAVMTCEDRCYALANAGAAACANPELFPSEDDFAACLEDVNTSLNQCVRRCRRNLGEVDMPQVTFPADLE